MKYTRCHRGYASVIVALDRTPMTREELAEHFNCMPNTIGVLLREFRGRVLRVIDWRASTKGPMSAVWGVGDGPDAVCTKYARKATYDRARPEVAAFIVLMNRLKSEPATQNELIELTGMSRNTVSLALRSLRPVIYIHGWDRNSHIPQAMWAFGKNRDADRPKRQSYSEVTKRYYLRQKERVTAQAIAQAFAPARVLEAA